MLCADKLGKAPFKLENPRPHPALIGQDSTAQDFDNCIDLFLSKKRLVDPDQFPQFFSWPPGFQHRRLWCLKELAQNKSQSKILSSSNCKIEKQISQEWIGSRTHHSPTSHLRICTVERSKSVEMSR